MLLAADARVWPVGGAGLVLVALGDPQGGNADRGKRWYVTSTATPVKISKPDTGTATDQCS